MNETYVTVHGNLVADPERRTTRGGAPFTTFRLATTPRRQNPRTGAYEDGTTSYYHVGAFRAVGLNAAASLHKGQPVIVTGRLRINQWQREDGSYGTQAEIDAAHIGHDLALGQSAFTKVTRAQSDPDDRMSDEEVQGSFDRHSGRTPGGSVEDRTTEPEDDDRQHEDQQDQDPAETAYRVVGEDGTHLRVDRASGELVPAG